MRKKISLLIIGSEDKHLIENFYKKAISVGGSLTCYNKLTTFYENQNQPGKAIANLEMTLKKHPHNLLNYQIGKLAALNNMELDKGEQKLFIYLQNYS